MTKIELADVPEDQRPPAPGARCYLAETWNGGAYDIEILPDGTYIARFREDDSVIPLHDMGYNREYGLFQLSAFPTLVDEDMKPPAGRPRIYAEPRQRLTLELPQALVRQLDTLADANEQTRTAWIESAIREKLERAAE